MLARRALFGLGAVGVVAVGLAAVLVGCPSSPAATASGADADADGLPDGPAICNIAQYLEAGGAGGPCSMPSPVVCFPVCTSGGCSCVRGPAGTPIWQCTNDTSCFPECGPIDDCGSGGLDAGVDANDATSEAGEASADVVDAAEASADASSDAMAAD